MLDFTSSLYLGLRHASTSLRPWAQLTAGVPSALREPSDALRVASELAQLTRTDQAVLARSTLHAFWDLFLAEGEGVSIHVDAGTYPIARWGTERAAARGVPVSVFPHHDPEGLATRLDSASAGRRRPVVVTDGLCPGCGGPAPLRDYVAPVREHGGFIVVDDTQALGILGRHPSPERPYGTGGGGSPLWSGAQGPWLLLVTSLAKGFGAPLAVVAGSRERLGRFIGASETRVHCSPPSFADVHAAERALALNRSEGESRRRRLASLVHRFREGLARLDLGTTGGSHPVQVLAGTPGLPADWLHRFLLRHGVRTVLLQPECQSGPRLAILITAAHRPEDINRTLEVLARARHVNRPRFESRRRHAIAK